MTPNELRSADMKASSSPSRYNAEYKKKEVMVVTIANVGGKNVSVTYAVEVPVLTNAVAVKAGESLIMQVTPKATAGVKRKEVGWKDHAKTKKAKAGDQACGEV